MKRRKFLVAGLAAASLPLVEPLTAWAADTAVVQLENDLWRLEIDPRTLAIHAWPSRQAGDEVSRGVGRRGVSELVTTHAAASWTWADLSGDARYRVSCELRDRDLNIAITASQAGSLDLIDQPQAAMGRGMMLPLAEGSYVPAGDRVWRDFLAERESELNTTEDLSLPLWGLDHGAFTLHWLLTNPFNNLLKFDREDDGLGLKVSHRFTLPSTTTPTTPMTLTLHLAKADLTAGARRYRRHLIESGTYETLSGKVARTPASRKIVGAPHVYLWGNGLVGEDDVVDWAAFATTLRGPSPLATALRGHFDAEAIGTLKDITANPPRYQRASLIEAFNTALQALARLRWQTDEANVDELVASYADLRRQTVEVFGRALRADADEWGSGLSKKTLRALQKTGLKRLWIGLGDGWEGGLWHPEVTAAMVDAGYLVAPYDSYDTAIAPGQRPDWATAQLGKAAFDTCGIVQQDGSVKSGFEKTGHYTNPLCVMPILKRRVAAIAKAAGFNSWFLDVTASGMVFDDYGPAQAMTMAQNAAANVEAARWIAETQQMPVGSEDGNAVTAGGVLFGHGMETPVIGWGDADLHKNAASPFYLGAWYPANQPSVFFKAVPMKEPYRSVYFAPQYRLPLYQSVFHGSVITTHHWLFDSMKLSNVRVERELTQLLYNVPPLYHLSAGSLTARLPAIERQNAFFQPLHEALAETTMDGFAWLSEDRLLQTTTFSDGSRLVANFDTVARQVNGMALPPRSVTAVLVGQQPRVYSAA